MLKGLFTPAKPQAPQAPHMRGETVFEWRHEKQRSPWQRFMHFWVVTVRGFVRNRCPVHATALAYGSLLALVPMLAVIAGISGALIKGDGEEPVRQFIDRLVATVTPAADENSDPFTVMNGDNGELLTTRKEIARRINEFVTNVNTGQLGVTGTVLLIFVGIFMLARIEDTFNDIWGVTRGRTWIARVVQYWAAITLGPALLIVALGLTTSPHLASRRAWLDQQPFLSTMVFTLLPFALLILAFAGLYQLMPNTRVQWRAALLGGLVGGCLWQLNNLFSVFYVSRVVMQSKIYGSLGLVPVLMIGLYTSWLILLFGAQVAYTIQNRRSYQEEAVEENVHQRGREFVALRLVTSVAQRFMSGGNSPTSSELAAALGIPGRLVQQLLPPLIQSKILLEVAGPETGYALARPASQITCHDVLDALRTSNGQALPTSSDLARGVVESQFERIQEAGRTVGAATTIEGLLKMAEQPWTMDT